MPRAVYISFLGTTPYEPASYPDPRDATRENAPATPYVQEAFLYYLQSDNLEPEVYTLVTPRAAAMHYDAEGTLGDRLAASGLTTNRVSIENPGAEDTIWRTFETFVAQLRDGDEVYLDVTHAFRVLPMLGFAALNYARSLRDITVAGIWYGEYDRGTKLASSRDVTAFVTVQDWAAATRALREQGSLRPFASLSDGALRRGSAEGKKAFGRRRHAFEQLRKQVLELTDLLQLANAHALADEGAWTKLRDRFAELRESYADAFDPAARPILDLLDEIERKLASGFDGESRRAAVVGWAADHDLLPQGFTMLDELTTTAVCESVGADPSDKAHREFVAGFLKLRDGVTFDPERYAVDDGPALLGRLGNAPRIDAWRVLARKIVEPRNALNHAGYDRRSGHDSADAYRKRLTDSLGEFESLLSEDQD